MNLFLENIKELSKLTRGDEESPLFVFSNLTTKDSTNKGTQ